MAADNKPVWVDEDAHRLLKSWAKAQKRPMVEVASELVLQRLGELDPSAGLITAPEGEEEAEETEETELIADAAPDAPGNTAPPTVTVAREQGTADAPAAAEATSVDQSDRIEREVRPMHDANDRDRKFLGGIWLV